MTDRGLTRPNASRRAAWAAVLLATALAACAGGSAVPTEAPATASAGPATAAPASPSAAPTAETTPTITPVPTPEPTVALTAPPTPAPTPTRPPDYFIARLNGTTVTSIPCPSTADSIEITLMWRIDGATSVDLYISSTDGSYGGIYNTYTGSKGSEIVYYSCSRAEVAYKVKSLGRTPAVTYIRKLTAAY
jgi:hypothetical protein